MRALAAELSAADARSRIGTTERAVIEHGDHATLGSFHRARVVDAPPFDAPRLVDVGIMGVEASGELVARMDAAR